MKEPQTNTGEPPLTLGKEGAGGSAARSAKARG